MQHRVANSLQIIASILLLKARTVQSEETRLHLQDAHQRVMSVATVQQQLHASGLNEKIEIGPYLTKLCASLAASMIGERRPLSIKVLATAGGAVSSEAVSIGLIVTELVINALKHGFPAGAARNRTTLSRAPTRSTSLAFLPWDRSLRCWPATACFIATAFPLLSGKGTTRVFSSRSEIEDLARLAIHGHAKPAAHLPRLRRLAQMVQSRRQPGRGRPFVV